jgi:HTH-type transcriptional regulator/antitoxin HigA
MEALQYKIIKTDSQYNKYCSKMEALVATGKKTKAVEEEVELLTLLIEKYDQEKHTLRDADPVELLKALMAEHKLKAVGLAKLLNVSEGLISDILHYKKGFSKETIRILADNFKLNQDAFNRPYKLRTPPPQKVKRAKIVTRKKKLVSD